MVSINVPQEQDWGKAYREHRGSSTEYSISSGGEVGWLVLFASICLLLN
jgi:hypothetical protein